MNNHTGLTLKIYWQHIKEYPWSGIITILATILASACSVVVTWYFKIFFDLLSLGTQAGQAASALVVALLWAAGWEFTGWIFWRFSTFFASYFQAGVIADLSNTCFKYLHRHSFAFFNNNFVGSLVKRVNRFTRAFEDISDRMVYDVLQLLVKVVLILFVVFYRNLYLGFGLVVWIIVFLAVNWLFVRYKLPYDIKRSEADSNVSAILADTFTNQVNVKLFNGYEREVGYFGLAVKKLRSLRLLTWNFNNFFEAVQGFLTIVLEFGLFFAALHFWRKGLLTIGDFVLVQTYLVVIVIQIWNFGRVIQRVYESLAEAEEMTVMLNIPWEVKDVVSAQPLVVTQGRIEFQAVSFYYHSTRSIFKDFSLAVAPKEKIALVGPSGAGKSTITKLILRLYDVSQGKILIDGQDITRVSAESLWQNVGLVPQDPILFHRSLLENIRYGRPEATDEEIFQAAKLAHCHEFISEFPDGYNTFVGERGVKLSGGERQRVAIARAILRNAPILVLDEATSSLDSESEHLIQDALRNLMSNKTVVVVAHRLSTIMFMDRIVVIEEGKIVEEGTHQQLLKKRSGLYKKLWQLQAGGFID